MQRRNGRASQARRLLNNWLRREPDDVLARLSLSDQLYAENKLDAAQAQYIQVLARDADNVLALNNLAGLLHGKDDVRALALAERAYEASPGSAEVLDTLGWILVGTGSTQRGLDLIERALALRPDDLGILAHRDAARQKLGQ